MRVDTAPRKLKAPPGMHPPWTGKPGRPAGELGVGEAADREVTGTLNRQKALLRNCHSRP